MTKQTQKATLEDYPELMEFRKYSRWDAVTIHKNEYYAYGEQDVEEKLLSMQARIDELTGCLAAHGEFIDDIKPDIGMIGWDGLVEKCNDLASRRAKLNKEPK